MIVNKRVLLFVMVCLHAGNIFAMDSHVHSQTEASSLPLWKDGESPINIVTGKSQHLDIADPQFLDYSGIMKMKLKKVSPPEVDGHYDSKFEFEADLSKKIEENPRILIDSQLYFLKQFHFHLPGEHKVDGIEYAAEAHFVHMNKDGEIAVVGLLFKKSTENGFSKPLDKFLKIVEKSIVEKSKEGASVFFEAGSVLPLENPLVYRYIGSLTAHTYAKNVKWVIFQQEVEISERQLEQLRKLNLDNSNREIQDLKERCVVVDTHIQQ